MGYYINPPGMTKEDFLDTFGVRVDKPPKRNVESGKVAICLVDNGWMTAAGIAVDKRELEEFKRPDGRPRQWYLVPLDKIVPDYVGEGVIKG